MTDEQIRAWNTEFLGTLRLDVKPLTGLAHLERQEYSNQSLAGDRVCDVLRRYGLLLPSDPRVLEAQWWEVAAMERQHAGLIDARTALELCAAGHALADLKMLPRTQGEALLADLREAEARTKRALAQTERLELYFGRLPTDLPEPPESALPGIIMFRRHLGALVGTELLYAAATNAACWHWSRDMAAREEKRLATPEQLVKLIRDCGIKAEEAHRMTRDYAELQLSIRKVR